MIMARTPARRFVTPRRALRNPVIESGNGAGDERRGNRQERIAAIQDEDGGDGRPRYEAPIHR